MLRMSLLDNQETFLAVGRRTGLRRIIVLDVKELAQPQSRYNLRTREGEEVAPLGSGMYLVLPTGEILTQTEA